MARPHGVGGQRKGKKGTPVRGESIAAEAKGKTGSRTATESSHTVSEKRQESEERHRAVRGQGCPSGKRGKQKSEVYSAERASISDGGAKSAARFPRVVLLRCAVASSRMRNSGGARLVDDGPSIFEMFPFTQTLLRFRSSVK